MQTKSEIKDFTHGNLTKQLITFALPLFFSNLLQIVYNMADMIIVGKVLGKEGISSVSVGGDVTTLLTFAAIGFSSAGQVIIARFIGGNEKHKIGRFVGTMGGFLAAAAVIISAVSLIFRHSILDLMNTPISAYKGALDYSTICMSGLIFIYGYNTVSAILRGMGDSKHPFIFISISAVLNVILDLIFVATPLDMGAAGAALATVISQGVSFISCTVFLICRSGRFELSMRFKDFFAWEPKMLGALLKLGFPMALKSASVHVSKLFVNSFINSYGVAVSAFSGIANKLASIANLISMAMNTAGSTVVGQNIAAGTFKRAKKAVWQVAAITFGVAIVLSAVISIFPEQIFGLFTDEPDPEVTAIAFNYVPIAVLMFFGAASRAPMNALINGSGNYATNFVTAILDGIVMRIGLALIFGLVIGMHHYGFWLGDALAGFTPFFVGIVFYFTGNWKKGKIANTPDN